MGKAFASGKHAFGFCDICGFRYPLHELKTEVINLEQTDTRACPECWSPDNPQTQLGRHHFDDPQALRNPRPNGATSGRELPYAQRWEFASVTELSNPARINGWHVNSGGSISHNADESMLTLEPVGADAYIMNGYNSGNVQASYADNVNLGIDASIYKYASVMARINNLPSDPSIADSDFWDGKIFFGNDTTITNGLTLTQLVVDSSGNATFTYTYSGTSQVAVGNRYNFYNLSGTYNGVSLSTFNGISAEPAGAFKEKYKITAVTDSTFTVNFGFSGDGSTMALSGTPTARCPYPYVGGVSQSNIERPPHLKNIQPSGGFESVNKPLGTYIKLVWDLSDEELWTGTISTVRFDFYKTNADNVGGSLDIQWIAIQSYHNPNL
tara:strand:- start:489 stop:1637 length:1149 start_codon:yes stop_codon:yes gene_type:complete